MAVIPAKTTLNITPRPQLYVAGPWSTSTDVLEYSARDAAGNIYATFEEDRDAAQAYCDAYNQGEFEAKPLLYP